MAVSNNALLSGGAFLSDSAAGATAVAVKASSAVLYEIEVDNTGNGAPTYLKLYNNGAPTVGTTAPDMIFMVPASVFRTLVIPSGITFNTALSYAAVTAGGTAGTTPPTSSVPVKMVYV